MNQAAVCSIVIEGWPKVEPDQPEVVPGFANRVVNHDEGAARCQRVACKVEGATVYAVVCGY